MEADPDGRWSGPTHPRDEETATNMLEVARNMNGDGPPAPPVPASERGMLPTEPIGALIERERARLQAEERAVRAEEEAAALRVALAVVTSVAEVTIEAAAQLVDEARRYAQTVADSTGQAGAPMVEVPSSEALLVINEARAAVAQLRADLLEDLSDHDPGEEIAAAAEVGSGQPPPQGHGSDESRGEAPGPAGAQGGRPSGDVAPSPGWISPSAAEHVG